MRSIIVGLIFFSLHSTAQNEIWNKLVVTEPARAQFAVTKMVIGKFNDKYVASIVGGNENDSTAAQLQLYKYNEFDELIWEKRIAETENNSELVTLFVFSNDSKDNIYLGFSFTNEIFIDGERFLSVGNSDAILLKVNIDGDMVFSKQFGGHCIDQVNEIYTDEDNHIYVGGLFGYFGFDTDLDCNVQFENKFFKTDNYSNGNYFIVKLDFDGELLWHHTGGGNGFDALHHIDIQQDYLYLAGTSSSISKIYLDHFTMNTPKSFNRFIFIAQLHIATGEISWAKYTGTSGALNTVSNTELKSSGSTITLLGTISTGENGKGNHLMIKDAEPLIWNGFGEPDYFLINYDTLGNVNWTRQGLHTGRDNVEDLVIDHKNNHYVAGYGNSNFIFNNDTIATQGSNDIFIACYNFKGEEQWIKTAGGKSNDTANSLALDMRGRIYVCGGTASHPTTFGDITVNPPHPNNLFLARLSNDTIVGIDQTALTTTTKIYPNPASERLWLKPNKEHLQIDQITIFDTQGKNILHHLSIKNYSIAVDWLPAGIYFLTIKYQNNKQEIIKWCKQ